MHSKVLHQTKTIRFRRWSRAGYAVFCSLACSVTIGCLAISISDKSLQKSNNTSLISLSSTSSDADSPEKIKAQAELEEALQQMQEVILSEVTFDSAVACGQFSLYLFNHHSG